MIPNLLGLRVEVGIPDLHVWLAPKQNKQNWFKVSQICVDCVRLGSNSVNLSSLAKCLYIPRSCGKWIIFIFSICQVFPELRNVSQIYPKDWCCAFSTLLRSVNLPPKYIYLYDMRLSLGFVWWSLVQLAHLQHLVISVSSKMLLATHFWYRVVQYFEFSKPRFT